MGYIITFLLGVISGASALIAIACVAVASESNRELEEIEKEIR